MCQITDEGGQMLTRGVVGIYAIASTEAEIIFQRTPVSNKRVGGELQVSLNGQPRTRVLVGR
jgi:hypothetical protein